MPHLKPLPDFRIPTSPSTQPSLDGKPLSILDTSEPSNTPPSSGDVDDNDDEDGLTPAIGIATILYNWHPNALAAFLDVETWVSMTWLLETPTHALEIGRIRNQVSFGVLDGSGEKWMEMYTFDISPPSSSSSSQTQQHPTNQSQNEEKGGGRGGGQWTPNPRESILPPTSLSTPSTPSVSPSLITTQSLAFLATHLASTPWLPLKKSTHKLAVEYAFFSTASSSESDLAVDDGDGIPMSPHWLYAGIDLSKCTVCAKSGGGGEGEAEVKRCGRCGTAAYCCGECQRRDWAVHKFVCTAGLEGRGTMLRLGEKGGLVGWAGRAGEGNEG
ncbi:unnamed protein product [Periconia digitata]|uniref:MYND-type domain-containing protein n=1 Tax=Periconia digitata TaxID=1303443 RepID=A0A9W4XR74_9PLEO|nr:unnamed protein product [Periconia digitata]